MGTYMALPGPSGWGLDTLSIIILAEKLLPYPALIGLLTGAALLVVTTRRQSA